MGPYGLSMAIMAAILGQFATHGVFGQKMDTSASYGPMMAGIMVLGYSQAFLLVRMSVHGLPIAGVTFYAPRMAGSEPNGPGTTTNTVEAARAPLYGLMIERTLMYGPRMASKSSATSSIVPTLPNHQVLETVVVSETGTWLELSCMALLLPH